MLKKDNANSGETTKPSDEVIKNQDEIRMKKTSITGIDVLLKYNRDACSLEVGNKKIDLSKRSCFYDDATLDLYNKFLTVTLHDAVNTNDDLLVYDYNGNLLFDDAALEDEMYEKEEEFDSYIYKFKVDNTKINYSINYRDCTNLWNGEYCLYDESRVILSCDDVKKYAESFEDNKNYEITFNGNRFSEPKLISTTKFIDSDFYDDVLKECK